MNANKFEVRIFPPKRNWGGKTISLRPYGTIPPNSYYGTKPYQTAIMQRGLTSKRRAWKKRKASSGKNTTFPVNKLRGSISRISKGAQRLLLPLYYF